MTPDEINERAWQQMQMLSDNEIINHPQLPIDFPRDDILDCRIRLRDIFFNELYSELKAVERESTNESYH